MAKYTTAMSQLKCAPHCGGANRTGRIPIAVWQSSNKRRLPVWYLGGPMCEKRITDGVGIKVDESDAFGSVALRFQTRD